MIGPDDYQCAIDVQDACNLSGVVFSFARVMQKLCDGGLDTTERNTHAIAVLYASKIASLTNCEAWPHFSDSYDEAKRQAD